jgi:hypothetical protein
MSSESFSSNGRELLIAPMAADIVELVPAPRLVALAL